jgi:hypothetical protein
MPGHSCRFDKPCFVFSLEICPSLPLLCTCAHAPHVSSIKATYLSFIAAALRQRPSSIPFQHHVCRLIRESTMPAASQLRLSCSSWNYHGLWPSHLCCSRFRGRHTRGRWPSDVCRACSAFWRASGQRPRGSERHYGSSSGVPCPHRHLTNPSHAANCRWNGQ